MSVRTGKQFLEGLKDGREVWLGGERVKDVTAHPGLARGAATLGWLLDRQHDPELRDLLTYDVGNGDRAGISFLTPRTREDVERRTACMLDWARQSGGMLGRTPDYLNSSFMSFAAAGDFFAAVRPEFGENVANYYAHIRDNDLVLTHTLVNPQVNRRLTAEGNPSEDVALHVVEENAEGIVVRGARLLATLGPISDEIAVFPSTVLRVSPESRPYSLAFALPNATPGMKYLCRDSYDEGRSRFDAPLSSRFEEMDSVVIFEDVLVPWERVFLYDSPQACNDAYKETNAVVHMMHQVICKNVAKADFMVGLMCAMAEASERDKLPSTQGMIAEAMWIAESMRSFLRAAEVDAEVDPWGVMVPKRRPLDTARNVFPKMFPRLSELMQLLGSSSLMALPSEADFEAPGIQADIEKYFHLAHATPRDRVELFRLAKEVAASGFGARQTLYERFFFGPPEIMASAYFNLYDKEEAKSRVETVLRAKT